MEYTKDSDLNFENALNLFGHFKKRKNDFNYKAELLLSLFKWRIIEDNIEDVVLYFNPNPKTTYVASSDGNQVNIHAPDIVNACTLKNMLDLIDSVFHELNHQKIKQDNAKQINFKPQFHFAGIYNAINHICKYDFDTTYSITLALYALNPNEKETRERTYNQVDYLLKALKEKNTKDKQLVKKLIKIHQKTNVHQVIKNLKHCLEDYELLEIDIKKKIEKFLLNYSKHPERASEQDIKTFENIHEIFPCQQAYQNLYNFYLSNGDLENSKKILNYATFTSKEDLIIS